VLGLWDSIIPIFHYSYGFSYLLAPDSFEITGPVKKPPREGGGDDYAVVGQPLIILVFGDS